MSRIKTFTLNFSRKPTGKDDRRNILRYNECVKGGMLHVERRHADSDSTVCD